MADVVCDAGLPTTSIVLCNFNAYYKLDPELWATWMRIMQRTAASTVLWMLREAAQTERNLWREWDAAGLAPERLLFAG